MKPVTTSLLLFVRDAISPRKLNELQISNLKSAIAGETSAIHLSFYELLRPEQQSERKMIFDQVVLISNQLHTYLYKLSPSWKEHPQAILIRSYYLFALNHFDQLMDKLGNLDAESYRQVKVTDFRLSSVVMALKSKVNDLSIKLNELTIEDKLREIVTGSLSQYIRKKGLTNGDDQYLKKLLAVLLSEIRLDSKRLVELLIVHDFSLPDFMLYCLDYWKDKLLGVDGLHDQLEMILLENDRLNYLSRNPGLQRPAGIYSLCDELQGFLLEKYDVINQLIELRREFLRDQQAAEESTRFQLSLPVAQFALLIRLLLEKGVLLKEHIGEVFSFFAAHFYTAKTPYISAESLQKQSTDVEFSTALKLKGLIIGMLNYLNANYNLANYKV
jgi:hypothetical protein